MKDYYRHLFQPITEHTRIEARCPYCGRYGELGQCVSCGAPNESPQLLGIIQSTKPISLETAVRIKSEWERAYSGPGNCGRIPERRPDRVLR